MILPVAAACLGALFVSGYSDARSSGDPEPNYAFVDKIVVSSDRHAPALPPQGSRLEIYLTNLDGSGEQRLTNNNAGKPVSLSPLPR